MSALCFLPLPCRSEVTELDFFPLYFTRTIRDGTGICCDEDWFWPFGRFEQSESRWSGAVRPFLSWGGDISGENHFYRFLPPIGLFDWNDRETDYRIQPFWYRRWNVLPSGEERRTTHLFPFFTFDTEKEEPSVAYSFLYGHQYNRFGVDESEWWFFPLFLKTRRRNFVNRNFLVPIFGYGSGGKGSNLRFWPLYGHKVIPGESASKFILWPFYGNRKTFDEDGNIAETIGCFPLYVTTTSPKRSGWSFLWPFFERQRVQRKRRDYDKLAAPFPFYQRIRDKRLDAHGNRNGGEDTLLVFPFYGHIRKDSKQRRLDAEYRTIFFWSIEKDRINKFTSSQRIFFPFVWLKTTTWASNGETSRDFSLWPLIHYEEPEKGGHHLRIFDPFWFRRKRDRDRHYSVLYTIYERERDRRGYGFDHILGKSIYYARYRNYTRMNFLHTVQFFDTPETGRGWSLARGLAGRSSRSGRTEWRFFWFRFGGT